MANFFSVLNKKMVAVRTLLCVWSDYRCWS